MSWRNWSALAVLIIGLTQMVGDLVGNPALKGLGAATAMAPSPKVFCEINGFEPFASTFDIVAEGDKTVSIRITPELYSHLKGPYNRRNVYGAAIAGAPLLPDKIRNAVLFYGFNVTGPLRRDLALPQNIARISISIRSNTRGRNQHWIFHCTE